MKEKFIKSTIILIIGGFLTKVLGMIIRIVMTRVAGLEVISLYMLINPTFSLFLTLSQFSLPGAMSKIVSEERFNNKKLMASIIPLSLIYNVLLIIIIVLAAPLITTYLLHDAKLYLPILAIILVIPFNSTSNIIRGYFFGKQNMWPHVLSNIIEQIIRLILIIAVTPTLIKINVTYAVAWFVVINMFSEISSIIILSLFLPRGIPIKKTDFKPQKDIVKSVLDYCFPNTTGRLISSISYFFEPIILTIFLMKNYSSTFIATEYGVISGYVLPILMLPSFFTGAIASAMLPVLSKSISKKEKINKKLKLGLLLSLMIGIPVTLFLIIKPDFLLKILYKSKEGTSYIKLLAPFFLLSYIEMPLNVCLQAYNKSKKLMFNNLVGVIIKNISLLILCNFKLGIYPLIISLCLSITTTTILTIRDVKKLL